MTKVIAIIPARSGSKSIQDKNIKPLCGHPILEWSLMAALKTTLIDKVFISTDSEKYANIAKNLGIDVPFLRPKKISQDHSTDLEFVLHTIREINKINIYPDHIVHLRPTTPIRDPSVIDEAIKYFTESNSFSSLRSVQMMSESSYKTLEIVNNQLVPLEGLKLDQDVNSARQNFPDTYQANGYVDVLSTEFVINNNHIHGEKVLPFITNNTQELDLEEDYKYLQYLANESSEIFEKLFGK